MNVFKKKELLIIGGVHIDILADYSVNDRDKLDKIGNISFAIGGTAFNIASNLRVSNIKMSLCSILNEDSQFTPHILFKLKEMNISAEYIQQIKSKELSAFVALRENGELISAVTCNLIENNQLEYAMLEKAISEHELIVADCNLSVFHLSDIIKICNYQLKPVIISAVSDSKVNKLNQISPNLSIDILSMNLREAQLFFNTLEINDIEKLLLNDRYKHLRSVVVTLGDNGFIVKTSQGELKRYAPPIVRRIDSSTGAGDALLAGVIYGRLKEKEIDWDLYYIRICQLIKETLNHSTATYNSLLSLNRIMKKKERIKYDILLAVIGILLSTIIGIIQIYTSK